MALMARWDTLQFNLIIALAEEWLTGWAVATLYADKRHLSSTVISV